MKPITMFIIRIVITFSHVTLSNKVLQQANLASKKSISMLFLTTTALFTELHRNFTISEMTFANVAPLAVNYAEKNSNEGISATMVLF